MSYKIYCLKDPLNGDIRYIGQTKTTLAHRLWRHVNIKEKHETHRGRWIESLKKQNLKPIIELLEICDNEVEMNNREIYLINEYKENGFDLVNSCDGGRGGDTFSMKSEIEKSEINKKRSESMKGKNKGKKCSEEQKAKIRKKLLGRKKPEHSKIMKEKDLGKKVKQVDINNNLIKIWPSFKELKSNGFRKYYLKDAIKNDKIYKNSKWEIIK